MPRASWPATWPPLIPPCRCAPKPPPPRPPDLSRRHPPRVTIAYAIDSPLFLLFSVAQAQLGAAPKSVVEAFNETADRVAARRAETPHPSTDAYREAWSLAPWGELSNSLRAGSSAVTRDDSDDKVRAPECAALFPKGSTAHHGIPGEACVALPQMKAALAALRRGAAAGAGGSLLGQWDTWHAEKTKGGEIGLRFVMLAHAAVLQGYVWSHSGKLEDAFDVWLAAAKMGRQLAQGPLLPNMLGAAIQGIAWSAIAGQLKRARPNPTQARRLMLDAAQLKVPVWRHDQVMQAEFVTMYTDLLRLLGTPDAHYPLAHEGAPVQLDGSLERLSMVTAMPTMVEQWATLVRIAGAPWPGRAVAYDDLMKQVEGSLHPIVKIAMPNFARYDRRAREQESRWKLLEVLAADVLGETVDRTDPLVLLPVKTKRIGAIHYIKSAVIGHPKEDRLSNADRDRPLAIATPMD